jgi:ubiquinone/menaquinone biosynthesis C-methylase UbiE
MASNDLRYLKHLAQFGRTELHPRGQVATSRVVDALEMSSGHRVLEIGCGTGGSMVTIGLTERVNIDGVDILPEMLAVARKRLLLAGLRSRSTLTQTDATDLPISTGTYDRAYAESVIGFQSPHVAQRILEEVFRVLRPSSRFVAVEAVWKRGVSAEVADAIYQSCISDFGLSQASQQPWNVDDWKDLMQQVGFTVSSEPLNGIDTVTTVTPGRRGAVRGTMSRALSWWFWISGRITPALARERRKYHELLRRHRNDGRHIEDHLFVLTRP